jgi:hypothetical protein
MTPEHIWVVLDEDGAPEYAALWPEACHEHINEAIAEGDVEGAEKWVVREYAQCPTQRRGSEQ